ncbi:MAG TPA: EAL domain-containing protein [Thiobacillaceae bacterium]|nr:EAL domain-containing protein [Thiobacillaceae bacterium]HNU64004.1 EAL domain-containing protein [Thiobacillaceae bacterium]
MSANAFIARQPIVNPRHDIIAYELLFRHGAHAQTAQVNSDLDAGIRIIANTLYDMGTKWLLQGKQAFINMDVPVLMSDFSSLLPKDNVVIEVLETVQATDTLLNRLRALKQEGYRLALDDFSLQPETEPLLPLADFVKLDVLAYTPAQLAETVKHVRRHRARLVAEKVESVEQFNLCRELGFDLFQGYYFARPENLVERVINPAHATILQLLEKVRQEDAEVRHLEALFKKDVALTFKLMRYINSAGFGLSCEVQSIRHAVSILGMQPMYRWLTLLLATAGTHATSPALARTAITRGRLCELLGQVTLPRNDQDNLFIVGVFSLLPAMLDMDMKQVLDRIAIPDRIADALLDRSGLYGPFLALAEAMERADDAHLEDLALSLMLTPEQVSGAHLQALTWVEQLGIE